MPVKFNRASVGSANPPQTDVLIIGGGIAGLAGAVALTGSGLRITVIEMTATLGGRAQSWLDCASGDVADIGPHILLTEYQNMLALLDVLGTRDRIVWHTEKLITLLENCTASMALMSVPLEECSAGALLPFYGQFVGHNGYSIGFPDCGLSEMFVAEVLRVIQANGGAVEMNSAVRVLTQQGQRCSRTTLTDGTPVTAKFCVSMLPPAELKEVLPLEWRERPELRNVSAFKPSPYVSVYLWFDRKLTREKFCARVWSPENLNYDFYDLSNIRRGWSARPSVIASNIIRRLA